MTTILLVEDDVHFRGLVATALAGRGYRVVEATSGREATAALRASTVDLMVVDGLLPDTNGLSLIAGLRASGIGIPIAFVSAFWRDPKSHRRLKDELGVSLVLHKPLAPEALGVEIGQLLEPAADQPDTPRSAQPGPQAFADTLAALRATFAAGLPERVRRLTLAVRRARKHPDSTPLVGEARSQAHRLRGTAGTYGFVDAAAAAGRIEDELVAFTDAPEAARASAWPAIDAAVEELVQAAADAERQAEPAQPATASYSPVRLAASRVLIVDDDPAFLDYVVELGRQQMIDVVVASGVREALAQVRNTTIDAAVIDDDLGAPGLAFDLARELRMAPGCADLPLAFVSWGGTVESRVAATLAGASLYLSKPLEAEAFGAALRDLASRRTSTRPRVLLLEDDPTLRQRVAGVLEADGMHVTGLEEPARILEVLETIRPDALVLDLGLPGLGGLEILRMLRTMPRWQELPVLVATGDSSLHTRLAAFAAGADDYLVKPIVDEELRSRIHVRVDRSRSRREREDHDVLTGLLLRRAFLEGLAARIGEARRHDRPLSLCLIDLDHFKRINDRHGHLAGDRVLTSLGSLLSRRFRAEDLRGRWGGEEFVLAFPSQRADTIVMVVERVLAEFHDMRFTGDHGEGFHASFSAGISTFPEDGVSADELLLVADRRLYRAKRAGRDRVCSNGDVMPARPGTQDPNAGS